MRICPSIKTGNRRQSSKQSGEQRFTTRPATESLHQVPAAVRCVHVPPRLSELRQPLTSSGSENVPAPLVTTNTQRPFTGSLTSMVKNANPISPPTAASGSSYSMTSDSSSVGGMISTSTRRTGLSVSACVSTTSANRACRSGPIPNPDSTPPDTVSLLSTTEADSARKAPVITPSKLRFVGRPRRSRGCGADRGGFGGTPPARACTSLSTGWRTTTCPARPALSGRPLSVPAPPPRMDGALPDRRLFGGRCSINLGAVYTSIYRPSTWLAICAYILMRTCRSTNALGQVRVGLQDGRHHQRL